jgi:hypothetical protein
MPQSARTMRNRLTELGSRRFGLKEKAGAITGGPDVINTLSPFAKAMKETLVHPSSRLEQTTLGLGRDLDRAELGIAASLGVDMDGPRQEGSGRTRNAAIPAARLLYYIKFGESHRPTCCYPDLYAGAQSNPRGGHC